MALTRRVGQCRPGVAAHSIVSRVTTLRFLPAPPRGAMSSFYLTLLVLGALALLLQLVMGLAGMHGDGLGDGFHGHGDGADGLNLFTIRALAAAAAAFGVAGLGLMQVGLSGWLALPVALVAAIAAAASVAASVRALRRLEQDRTFRLESAIGLQGTVALGIPGARAGQGKVHLVAHDRFQEVPAVTSEAAIPSGTPVLVIDVVSPDTLVVARSLPLLEEPHDPR